MDRIENIDFCIRYLLEQNHMHADIQTDLAGRQQLQKTLRRF